jgi:hypothetical protein
MKRIILLALAFIFISTISFAATVSKQKVDEREMTGKVTAVTLADPSKGAKSELIVTDDHLVKTTFHVNPTTTIYDSKFKAITMDKIKVDDKVKVKFTKTKEGIYEASSINILT